MNLVGVISSEPRTLRALSEQLRLTAGLDVLALPSAAAAAAALEDAATVPVLWLVDGSGPEPPYAIVERIRETAPAAAVLMLGRAAAGEADEVIERPCRLQNLLARVAAHLADGALRRRSVRIGPYELKPAEKLLVDAAAERLIRLTEKEVAILEFLARAEAPTSREELLHEVWGYQAGVTSHTLETHVYRLRQKIEQNPDSMPILVNEGGGYRLAW